MRKTPGARVAYEAVAKLGKLITDGEDQIVVPPEAHPTAGDHPIGDDATA